MVEELKLAIKIDDASIEQSLLKQFTNAQKMADKVVLDFKNVNFDNKQIEAKFKEMQKKAGQNPIDLSISGNTLDMLGQIDKRLTEIFSIGKGKSFIDSSSTVADIGKIENKINELNKKYEEAQKKLSSIGSGNISGKDVNLVDNKEFQKLSQEVSELKNQFDDLKTHMQLLDDYTVPTDRFFELQSQVETTTVKVSDLVEEFTKLSNAQKALSSTPQESNISSGMKDAFPSTEATASVEKTTQAIKEENNALEETANKAKQAVSELVKGRDVVSQNWYREKGTVIGKDSKGNDITRDVDEFSFVERLKNGQLQTVLATYDEETGKWAEQVINVRTAFEQVEKAIISADNKIASLEIAKERTLASHPRYDTTADDNQIAIERKKRDELQATLNLYGNEKKYVFEIEAATKRIADNQERLNNKKQAQTNLRQVVSDEQFLKDWDAAIAENNKRDAESAKQASKELNEVWNSAIKVNNALDETKSTLSSLPKMPELTSNFSDMKSKVSSLNSDLISGKITLSEYKNEVKSVTSEYSKMVSIQQKRDVEDYNANAKANLENAKNIQAEWDKNIKAIQDYMDAMTKLNNLKAKDKGTGSEANQIALQTQNVEELKQVAWDARKNLSSMQAENPDIIAWKQWVDMMELFVQASKGSAESAAKLKDVLDNIKVPSLDKYENKLASYQTKKGAYNATIARFNDGGWTSDEYLKNVQAVKDAVKKYEDLLNNIKAKGGIASEDDVQNLKEYESEIKKTISTVTNMSAAEKGYNFVSGQKELDKIHKLLNENSKMSSEAKAKIKAYYKEIESGNPSMSLDRIHGEIMKIYNAEVEAGRAGRSFFDTLKNSGFHQIAAQMAGMFGVYDVINVVRQGVNTVRELDEAMTEVRKVSNATETQYTSFRDTISSTAKEIATTNKELLNSSADFLRLGYSLDQASDFAKNATLFVNVGDGVDITEATEDMITAMKAFDIQAKDSIKIVDDYNQIGNQFALSASDIGEAMKRSASALETGNNSFEQSIGLITAMNEIVQNSENTGNSLKVLSLRLRGAKAELEDMQEDTDGLCDSTSKLREQIMSLTGVDIMLDDNTFKSTTDIIKELGAVWDKLSDSSQAATLELIAGKSRANNVAALLKNYQRIDEVMESLGDAEGSAMRENEAIVDSINGRIKVLSATAEEFWQNFIDTDFVKELVSLTSDLLNILTKIVNIGNGAGILGLIGAGTGIFKFIKNFDWVLKPYTKNSLQQFLVGQS